MFRALLVLLLVTAFAVANVHHAASADPRISHHAPLNASLAVNSVKRGFSRAYRDLSARQGCIDPGYANCIGFEVSCCPEGDFCCVLDNAVVIGCCPPATLCAFDNGGNLVCNPDDGGITTTTPDIISTTTTTPDIISTTSTTPDIISTTSTTLDITTSTTPDITTPSPPPDTTTPSPPPATTTPPPPPPPTTTTIPPPPPPPITTPPPPPTTSIIPSPHVAPFTQSFAPAPTPGSNLVNQTVNANDPRITTSGPDWNTTQSSCDSTMPAKRCPKSNETLTLIFTGQAVYMSSVQSSASGQYIVVVDDGAPVIVDGFTNSNSPTCGFGWSTFGLEDKSHTVIVTTSGSSPKASPNNPQTPTFELDGFVITQSSSSNRAFVSLPVLLTNTVFFVILAQMI